MAGFSSVLVVEPPNQLNIPPSLVDFFFLGAGVEEELEAQGELLVIGFGSSGNGSNAAAVLSQAFLVVREVACHAFFVVRVTDRVVFLTAPVTSGAFHCGHQEDESSDRLTVGKIVKNKIQPITTTVS